MNEEREDEIYAAYAAQIEVPEMWSGIEARLRRRNANARWMSLAAAAVIAMIVIGTAAMFFRAHPQPEPTLIAGPAGEASMHYRAAIARYEKVINANDPRAAALSALTRAIGDAEVAAAASPADPVVVTRLITAYDAKLETLRGAVHVQ